MTTKAWILFLVFCFASGVLTNDIISECQSWADCDVGKFCNYKLGYAVCERCIDCPGRFYRQAPSRRRRPQVPCAESVAECGTCLPGYQEKELMAGERTADRCQSVAKGGSNALFNTMKNCEELARQNKGLIAAITVLSIVPILLIAFKLKGKCSKTASERPQGYEQPPPYSGLVATAPPDLESGLLAQPRIAATEVAHTARISLEDDATQQAEVFHPPRDEGDMPKVIEPGTSSSSAKTVREKSDDTASCQIL